MLVLDLQRDSHAQGRHGGLMGLARLKGEEGSEERSEGNARYPRGREQERRMDACFP